VNGSEAGGLLWKLISAVANLNGHAVVDTGTQTDVTRYHAIVPLGQ